MKYKIFISISRLLWDSNPKRFDWKAFECLLLVSRSLVLYESLTSFAISFNKFILRLYWDITQLRISSEKRREKNGFKTTCLELSSGLKSEGIDVHIETDHIVDNPRPTVLIVQVFSSRFSPEYSSVEKEWYLFIGWE